MKTFLYALGVAIVMGSGLWVVAYYGDQTQPREVIPLQVSESLEAYAQALAEKLEQPLRGSSVLLLGVMTEQSEGFEITEALIPALAAKGIEYEVTVVEQGLGPEGFLPEAANVSLQKESRRLAEGLKNAQAQGLRTLIVVPAAMANPWEAGSPAARLREELRVDYVSLALAPIPLRREDEKNYSLPCRTETHDRRGMGSLGCVTLTKARGYYKEALQRDVIQTGLDVLNEKDYVGVYATPAVKEAP